MENIDITIYYMDLRYIGLSVGELFEPHCHKDEEVYEFHLVLEGQGVFYNGGQEYPLEPGTLFFFATQGTPCSSEQCSHGTLLLQFLALPRGPKS